MMKKDKIEKSIEVELRELNNIEDSLKRIKDKIIDKTPSHFSMEVIFNALFGSLLFGLTFILKGSLIRTALELNTLNMVLIIISSVAIIIGEIYFLGYAKIKDRKERRPGQFVIKRFLTLLIVSISVAFFLVYIFGIDRQLESFYDIIRVVIMTMMPCAVGAGFSSLFKE
jgi:uncharacterized membrane protein